MRCQKISYVPLKNQIRSGNSSERFVFLNQRHTREFLVLVLVFYRRPLGSSSVSAWFDFEHRLVCRWYICKCDLREPEQEKDQCKDTFSSWGHHDPWDRLRSRMKYNSEPSFRKMGRKHYHPSNSGWHVPEGRVGS